MTFTNFLNKDESTQSGPIILPPLAERGEQIKQSEQEYRQKGLMRLADIAVKMPYIVRIPKASEKTITPIIEPLDQGSEHSSTVSLGKENRIFTPEETRKRPPSIDVETQIQKKQRNDAAPSPKEVNYNIYAGRKFIEANLTHEFPNIMTLTMSGNEQQKLSGWLNGRLGHLKKYIDNNDEKFIEHLQKTLNPQHRDWSQQVKERIQKNLPNQLRKIFTIIMLNYSNNVPMPSTAKNLFNKFEREISEKLKRELNRIKAPIIESPVNKKNIQPAPAITGLPTTQRMPAQPNPSRGLTPE